MLKRRKKTATNTRQTDFKIVKNKFRLTEKEQTGSEAEREWEREKKTCNALCWPPKFGDGWMGFCEMFVRDSNNIQLAQQK